jgi:hypothetical protein
VLSPSSAQRWWIYCLTPSNGSIVNSRGGAPPVNRRAAEHMNSMTYVTIFLPLCAKYSLNCWHLNNAMHDRENNRSTTIRCMLGACRLFSAAAHQIDWLGVLPKIYPKLSHLYLRFASPCDGVISFFSVITLFHRYVCMHTLTIPRAKYCPVSSRCHAGIISTSCQINHYRGEVF